MRCDSYLLVVVLAASAELGIAVAAYSWGAFLWVLADIVNGYRTRPLGHGMLTGTIKNPDDIPGSWRCGRFGITLPILLRQMRFFTRS